MIELSSDQRSLLRKLIQNARVTQKEIGASLNFSPKKTSEMIDELKRKGVIQNFTTTINYAEIGYVVEGLFLFKLMKKGPIEIDEIKNVFQTNINIIAAYELFGREHDFMIRIMCRTNGELREVTEKINAMANVDNNLSYTYAVARIDKQDQGVPL